MRTDMVVENKLEAEAEILSAEDQFDLLTYISSGTDYDVAALSPVEEEPSIPKEESTVQPESTICPDTLSQLLSNTRSTKRKLPIITLDNLEELTASTTPKKFRSPTSSTASSVCGDSVSEASASTKKRRGRPPKQSNPYPDRAEYDHLNEEDLRYRRQRDKNNEASRKSRNNRRDRELMLEYEANILRQKHRELENEEQKLIRECARWRQAVMRLVQV
nr:cell death specification protein 2-like [Aedes albopictus]